jgi:FMN-dependent NADH-azoreductase
MTLFRLDASIRTEGSVSRAIADIVEQGWREGRPDEQIVRRHVGTDPVPAHYWGLAAFAGYTPEDQRSQDQKDAVAYAATLVDELVEADALLFAVPLYNFGVSQHLKAYIDMIITDPRMASGTEPLLRDKPAELVIVRGGGYGAGTPREGWDHATGWYRRIFEDVWHLQLSVVETELTLAEVVPAMESLRPIAAQLRAESEELALKHGVALGA